MTKKSFKDSYRDKMSKSNKDKDLKAKRGKSWFTLEPLELDDDDREKIMYKAKKGQNQIDVLPFIAKTANSPRCAKGDVDYLLDVRVHRRVGPQRDDFLCLEEMYGKRCPICEQRRELMEDGESKDVYKKFYPQRRVMYNMFDLTAEGKKKVQLFEVSHNKMEKEIQEEAETYSDGELLIFFDPTDGMSVTFRGKEATFEGAEFIDIKKVSLEERDKQYKEDEILEKTYALDELLVIPTYEEVSNSFHATESDPDDEDDRPAKKAAKKEADDDEEEPEEKPTKKSATKKETDDDDDEEEKPAPKSKKTAEPEEDDEEDEPEEKPAKKSKGKASGDCPHGHEYGKDCDKHDECEDCNKWDECSDEFTRMKKKG